MTGYARAELLAEPDWMWEHRDDPNLRLIDCARSADAYNRAHIPGAVALPVHPWIKDGVHVLPAEKFAETMGGLGVSDETTVVAYDDFNNSFATRLWWALGYYGHRSARVLNGGWQRWLAEGRPITIKASQPTSAQFLARTDTSVICDLDFVKAHVGDPKIQIINALPAESYRGSVNPFKNRRVGHIPGSVNVPIERFLTTQNTFRSADEIATVLREAGLEPARETVVHCQAGIRTTAAAFALALLGWDRVRAYDASMAEWANRDDTPLEIG